MPRNKRDNESQPQPSPRDDGITPIDDDGVPTPNPDWEDSTPEDPSDNPPPLPDEVPNDNDPSVPEQNQDPLATVTLDKFISFKYPHFDDQALNGCLGMGEMAQRNLKPAQYPYLESLIEKFARED